MTKAEHIITAQNQAAVRPNKFDSYKLSPTYLEILLPMEDNGFCLDFSVLNIHFVATQHYGDVFTYSYQISVPIRYVLVSNSWCYIKHYDGTLSCKKRIVKSYIRRVSTCSLDGRGGTHKNPTLGLGVCINFSLSTSEFWDPMFPQQAQCTSPQNSVHGHVISHLWCPILNTS